VSETQLLGGAN